MKFSAFVISMVFALGFVLMGCGDNPEKVVDIDNVFVDDNLRKICEHQMQGNATELIGYSQNSLSASRKAAIMALGSMRDTLAAQFVASKLKDSDPDVEQAALHALGMIGYGGVENSIIDFYGTAFNDELRAAAIEALGRCGGEQSIAMIDSIDVPHGNVVMVSAICRSLVCFAQRGFYSVGSLRKALDYLCDTTIHEKARTIASEYLVVCPADIAAYTDELISAYQGASMVGLCANVATALGKCHNERAFSFLKGMVEDPSTDSRIAQNAIAALQHYPYYDCKDLILNMLKSEDDKVSVCAAHYLLRHGIAPDSSLYMDCSLNVDNWQTRAVLLSCALKYSNSKQEIARRIQSGFDKSPNILEKVALLHALAYDMESLNFMEKAVFSSGSDFIRHEGLLAIVDMYEDPEYGYNNGKPHSSNDQYFKDFTFIFKEALNGDARMQAIAADVIARNEDIAAYYTNTFFLSHALDAFDADSDRDTYLTLANAVRRVVGTNPELRPFAAIHPDWDYIQKIPSKCNVKVSTSRGDIVMCLDVSSAPVAVSHFLKLVDDKYFDGTMFVWQPYSEAYCYGSISGFDNSKTIKLPAELGHSGCDEGSVSLITSALNNSCTTQWSISSSYSTLNLSASTVIGNVVEGMSVVHSLRSGDLINGIVRM